MKTTLTDRVTIDPQVCDGMPAIRDTRVLVSAIIDSLLKSLTFDQVCREYGVDQDDIQSALRFATSHARKKGRGKLFREMSPKEMALLEFLQDCEEFS